MTWNEIQSRLAKVSWLSCQHTQEWWTCLCWKCPTDDRKGQKTKTPFFIKKSNNQAYLECRIYELGTKYKEKDTELNGREQFDDLPVNTLASTERQGGENKIKEPKDSANKRMKCKNYKEGQKLNEIWNFWKKTGVLDSPKVKILTTHMWLLYVTGKTEERYYHNPNREEKLRTQKVGK